MLGVEGRPDPEEGRFTPPAPVRTEVEGGRQPVSVPRTVVTTLVALVATEAAELAALVAELAAELTALDAAEASEPRSFTRLPVF